MSQLPPLFILVALLVAPGCSVYHPSRLSGVPRRSLAHPTVSPSGKKVAFGLFSFDGNIVHTSLQIMSLASGDVENTGAELSARLFPITWHPTEQTLVFISAAHANFHGLERMDVRDFKTVQISDGTCWSPHYSRDGQSLGFIKDDDLIIENTATGKEQTVAEAVNHWFWCWDSEGESVFYIQDDRVFRHGLDEDEGKMIVDQRGQDESQRHIGHLTLSPDGSMLGFQRDKAFHVVKLDTLTIRRLFECDHYCLKFDWTNSGIVYLDQSDGDRNRQARLMVFDPIKMTAREVATGQFSFPHWVSASDVLARVGSSEFWLYNVPTAKGTCIFRATLEDEEEG